MQLSLLRRVSLFYLFAAALADGSPVAERTFNATPEIQIRSVGRVDWWRCRLKAATSLSDITVGASRSTNNPKCPDIQRESHSERPNSDRFLEATCRLIESQRELRDRRDGRMRYPQKTMVVGTGISMTSYEEVIGLLDERPSDRATVVVVCTVHSIMSARRSPELAEALASADINTSDGVPLVWAIRWTARPDQERVYGPELTRRAIAQTVDRGWRHYFYGSTPETLTALEEAITRSEPDAQIVGSYSPPFRPLTEAEAEWVVADIKDKGADVVWVGLGMPKQELWMHEVRSSLPGVALVGVGAAFDFIAGTKKEAPAWIQRSGLEWLFRLWEEPRRLWRRYIFNNPAFALLLAKQIAFQRLGRGNGSQRT